MKQVSAPAKATHMFTSQLLACPAVLNWLLLLCAGLEVQEPQECDPMCKTRKSYCGQP